MSDQKLQMVRMRRHVLRDLKSLGRGRGIADQHGIEACRFMHLREVAHIVAVDPSANDMHGRPTSRRGDADHPQNINGHEISSTITSQSSVSRNSWQNEPVRCTPTYSKLSGVSDRVSSNDFSRFCRPARDYNKGRP